MTGYHLFQAAFTTDATLEYFFHVTLHEGNLYDEEVEF